MFDLTENEQRALLLDMAKVERLRSFLSSNATPSPIDSADAWFGFVDQLRTTLGNISNAVSLAACILAKRYLESVHEMLPFDVAEKPQGANGPDIDARTSAGERVIGELKTTIPYLGQKFGAAQLVAMKKDFQKLVSADAEHKYMFVTHRLTEVELSRMFPQSVTNVAIVRLAGETE